MQKGLKHSPKSLELMGEIFGKQELPLEALDSMGVQPGKWTVGLEEVLSIFEGSETRLVEMLLATNRDWDRYQSKHGWVFDHWCWVNQDDPELETLVAYAEKSRLDDFR